VTLRVSLNGGLNFEDSDTSPLTFNVLAAPNIEKVTFSKGFAHDINAPFITVGRQEQKTVTLWGTNLQVLQGRSPVCLFGKFTRPATFIDEFHVTCLTPCELKTDQTILSQELVIGLKFSDRSPVFSPAMSPKVLTAFTWPLLRKIDDETSTRLLDY
jgi:hypothetical protein